MTDRMPPLPPEAMTPDQARAAEAFAGDRGTPVFGPFVPLLRSPELMLHLQKVGAHCRYRSALGLGLTEFTILLVARRHAQPVEWAIHAPIAAEAGVAEETIAALLEGRRPPAMSPDETLVFDAVAELWAHGGWSDATYAAIGARFGEAGIIDLVGTVGYYATIAMVMNVARTEAPGGFRMPPLP
ncbi:carboxymuconolactone decarboxylase family protein [Salinarimonas soli]|uniref:Carboxymuconolactone decarboxylase family protein n=1 Tax=Salinarimonas soli TaxID=1638099 RepID=A0A5B2VFS2_9HYPH|nr:carboxymuconolactone decarboxylase family protein [Salinarimonas soli]KAA2237202.1 carboxymuconolactone decarboxylase family protein [Salinarimonas soli]